MKYTVTFSDEAEADLALIWLSAPDRDSVTNATSLLDALLRHDAHEKGRRRNAESNERAIDVLPIQCVFSASPVDRLVTVLHIRHVGGDT
ncbi:hypothetical protein [Stratiformator vulcanicus]|uniref:Plasmid stabilization system protein n=1 Tax=Stratiformator vulcanicus TaxID=2527980 RepID=A0A517QXG3_9PLAN|nr:hypothetical protein [Stratiformator vulcanicus]QDT36342.1 hypothetical protein Pan189_06980 [Stratiformator vulcanicus]